MPTKTVRSHKIAKRPVARKRRIARSGMETVPTVMASLEPMPPQTIQDPMPMPAEPMPGPSSDVADCGNCGHMPVTPNAVLGILVVVVFMLSTVVFASAMIISSQSFQINAFRANGGQFMNVAHR